MRKRKEQFHPVEVVSLIHLAGFNRQSVAKWMEVSERTVDRWISSGNVPGPALRALELRAGCDPEWKGFRFRGPYVITPMEERIHYNQIESLSYQLQLAKSIGALEERKRIREDMARGRPKAPVVPLHLVKVPKPSPQEDPEDPDPVPMVFALL